MQVGDIFDGAAVFGVRRTGGRVFVQLRNGEEPWLDVTEAEDAAEPTPAPEPTPDPAPTA